MLDTIIEHQRHTYKDASLKPLDQIPKSQRSLFSALRGSKQAFIFECKKASPSKGVISSNYNPIHLAQSYKPFAQAISVLTNEPFFDGSFKDLREVSQVVDCPVLAKDIVVSQAQIIEARIHGADAILLMLSVLDDKEYLQLRETAKALDLDVITEIHDEHELTRALQFKANIIGINHRDFKTMRIDLSNTSKLAPKIPSDVVVIAESGINSYSDIKTLSPYASAFLIGSHLSGSTQPDLTLRKLLFQTIKLCGLTSVADAQVAYQQGASMGGLIFTPNSPRCVSFDQAKPLSQVPLQWVGVFQDQDIATVVHYVDKLNLKVVQCHGHESLDYITELRQKLPKQVQIFKAVNMQTLHDYSIDAVDGLVLDHQNKTQLGGTGCRVDLSDYRRPTKPVLLAGGLGPHTIQDVLSLDFDGFDINSQVEQSPGIKCPQKIKELFNQIESHRRSSHAL